MDEKDATERLQTAMDDARLELGVKWEDIAQRAGVSISTLHRFRKGEGPRTPETTRRIEKVYGWGKGHVEAIISGNPLPPPEESEPELPESEPDYDDMSVRLNELIGSLQQMQREVDGMRRKQKGA